MKSSPGSTDKVIDVKARERLKRGVRTFIDRLGLEWFLEGNGDRLSFKIKDRSIERCAMWLCDEKELLERNSNGGETDFYLKIENPEELEKYKRMVRREVLRYLKKALER
jgi:hypothetical protein